MKEIDIINIRESKLFSETNFPWNKGNFNSRANVGSLTELCKQSNSKTYLEFEQFYNKQAHKPMLKVAEEFYNYLNHYTDLVFTKEDVKNFVYIRIIYETFLGYNKEQEIFKHIVLNLKKQYKLAPATTYLDFDYSVDAEIYQERILICGIQIKSNKYKDKHEKNNTYIHRQNKEKNDKYTKRYFKPVYYIYYTNNIFDTKSIKHLLQSNT